MAKKRSSKAKTITGTDVTETLTGIKESKPISSGTSCSINQPSETIRNLIRYWLTEEEASDILSQFRKACIPNHQLLWSGMPRATAQQWADTHGFQTLTTSLGPLLRSDDPDCYCCRKIRKSRSNYIHGASIIFSWFISQGDLVTVLSQPPPQRFHPTGRSFYQLYEEPIVKGMLGNRPVTRIMVAHPTIKSAIDFTYEMWPHDEVSLWTNSFGMEDIVIYWRQVKTANNATKLLAKARMSVPSASTAKSDVVKSCGSLAISDSNDLKSSESLATNETDNMKSFGGSASTRGKATKEDEKNETSNEPKQAKKKQKSIKKDKKSKDKSLSTSETTNDLQEITIEKLVRDETSASLQLLIDAAYGIIDIEVGESMEEKKERKKAEKRDRKMVKRMDMKARGKNSSKREKSNRVNKITIEMLVKDETSESLQLLIDAAYGIIEIEVGESMEEKKERKKREKEDRKIVLEMKHRIEKQKEEMSERIDGTKEATTNILEEDGSAQNTRSKARAKKELKQPENEKDKEAGPRTKTKKMGKGFLGKKLLCLTVTAEHPTHQRNLLEKSDFSSLPFGPVMPHSEPAQAQPHIKVVPGRSPSGNSHETEQSDLMKWFDHLNQNPTATANNSTIESIQGLYSDRISEDTDRTFPKLAMVHSSSSNYYPGVINDLTVEAQKVREKMKRYKQSGPAILHKDKLFEIKVHGLSKEKKKERKTTLRDFTGSLNNSGASSLQGKKKPSRHNGDHIYSGSEIQLNHASSSSSSLRPADSAYASMSTNAKCASTSLGRPTRRSTESLKQKVEDYLRHIPEGLYSQYVIMIDKEWKNVVIQRLEQLFTGKISGRYAPKKHPLRSGDSLTSALAVADAKTMGSSTVHERPPPGDEPTQGAKIVPLEQYRQLGNKNPSGRHGSTFHPNEDHMEIGCNDNNTVFGTNLSPPMPLVSEQRPSDIMRPVAKPTESQGQENRRRKHQYEGDIARDRKNNLCGDAGKAKCCDGVGDKVEGIFGKEAGGYGEDYGRGDLDDGYDGADEGNK
uniref:Uncharacterized protein n=1 Tax=Gibberella zeae TaxID=5518 RepID=A0A4E9DY29_GIBZA